MSRRTQLIVALATSAGLIFFAVWAWRSANLSLSELQWWAVGCAFFIAAPLTLLLKMFEYDASARIVEARCSWRRSLEVSVISAAANLLPIPGSVIVTTRSLSEQGATYGAAAIACAVPGFAWL